MPLGGTMIPVLSCEHLAVFKTLFDRPKDYVDLADMVEANSFDVGRARTTLVELLGVDARQLEDFDAAVADGRDPDRDEPSYRFPRV